MNHVCSWNYVEAVQVQRGVGLIIFCSFSKISYSFFLDFFCFSCFFVNTVLQIVTRRHSTPFPIMPHVLICVVFMCAQTCGMSYAPKFGTREIIIRMCSCMCFAYQARKWWLVTATRSSRIWNSDFRGKRNAPLETACSFFSWSGKFKANSNSASILYIVQFLNVEWWMNCFK